MALSPTQRQSFTVSSRDGVALGFAQFDPALGTLNGVTVQVTAIAAGSVAVENLEQGPVTVQAGLPVSIAAYVQQYYYLGASAATASGSVDLAAFDGTADYAGASGAVLAGLSGSHTETFVYGPNDWPAAAFVGTAEVAFTARGNGSLGVSGGAGLRLLSEPDAMAGEIAVTYDYTPVGGTTGSVTTVVTNNTDLFAVGSGQVLTVTTGRQVRSVAAQTTGWTQSVTLDGFNPALGTLVAVNLRVRTGFDGSVMVENHGTDFLSYYYNSYRATHGVLTTASVAGAPGPLATAQAITEAFFSYLLPFDGVDDFAGASGGTYATSGTGVGMARVTDPAALATFAAAGPVDVALHGGGIGNFAADQFGMTAEILAQMQATASAELEVSYSYTPAGDFEAIAVANGAQGTREVPTGAAYAGPVAGILNELAVITPDSLAISAGTDSWYIRTGGGTDAIQVAGGTNVLDGGGGSNYLVGGAGQDTFFVDASWTTAPLWNTIDGFSSGDATTIWGITSWGHLLSWRDGQGAPGASGLTLHARAPGLPPVSTTFVGYSQADLSNGVLSVTYGTADDLPYMMIRVN